MEASPTPCEQMQRAGIISHAATGSEETIVEFSDSFREKGFSREVKLLRGRALLLHFGRVDLQRPSMRQFAGWLSRKMT
jgi:hypothetical protein